MTSGRWRKIQAKRAKQLRFRPVRAAWDAAHGRLTQSIPTVRQSITKGCLVTIDGIDFRSVWKKQSGVWSCTATDPRLGWMVGKSQAQVHLELIRLGATWRWVGLEKGKPFPLVANSSSHPQSPLMAPLSAATMSDARSAVYGHGGMARPTSATRTNADAAAGFDPACLPCRPGNRLAV